MRGTGKRQENKDCKEKRSLTAKAKPTREPLRATGLSTPVLRSDNTAKPKGIERRTVDDDRHPAWCPSENEHQLRRAETESCGRDLPTDAASCAVQSGSEAAGRGCPPHPPLPRLGYSVPQTKHTVRVAASDPLQLSSPDAASGSLNPAAAGRDTSLPAGQRAGPQSGGRRERAWPTI